MTCSLLTLIKTKKTFQKGLFLMCCLSLAGAISCSPQKKGKNTSDPEKNTTYTLEIVPKQKEGKTIQPTREEVKELIGNLNNRLLDWDFEDTATLQDNGTISLTLPAEDDPEYIESVKQDLIACRHIELIPVHTNNRTLAPSETTHVPGYKVFDFVIMDDENKEHTEKLLLSKRPIITDEDIEKVEVDSLRPGILNVTLTSSGGEKMKYATSTMVHGNDRIAILIDGRIISAPVVQSTLSLNFQISGLDRENEPEYLATMLNYPLKWTVRFVDEKTKAAPHVSK